jgi:hypothetical protein
LADAICFRKRHLLFQIPIGCLTETQATLIFDCSRTYIHNQISDNWSFGEALTGLSRRLWVNIIQ